MGKNWFMYVIIAIIVAGMLKNAAGAVGIIIAGGSEFQQIAGTLEGSAVSTKGSFSTGKNTIKLG